MQVRINRASIPADHSDYPPLEGAVYDWSGSRWTLRISTMDELFLLCRRLNETLMVEQDGPQGLQVTIFDVIWPSPRPSEDTQ